VADDISRRDQVVAQGRVLRRRARRPQGAGLPCRARRRGRTGARRAPSRAGHPRPAGFRSPEATALTAGDTGKMFARVVR
jgi:hypothetical protein